MKSIHLIFLALISMILISGCDMQNEEIVVGTGELTSKDLDLPVFDGINITGTCNVKIVIGKDQSVKFIAQSEILDLLTYEIKNNILNIGVKPGYTVKTNKEISAQIVIPSVSSLSVTGKADFILIGEKQELLDIKISGVGNVKAYEMEVNNCKILISGTGNCEVNVVTNLDVTISGMGNVSYMGNPTRTTNITGVGNVTATTP